jgi:hypothetical protein
MSAPLTRLVTSDAFAASLLCPHEDAACQPILYDEGSLLRLDHRQQDRELFVRCRLTGTSVGPSSASGLHTPGVSTLDRRGRIDRLKRQIEEVRRERKRILADGVRKVQSYMEQLRREHAQHAQEMQELRDSDARLNERFLKEVEQLKLQYSNHKVPIDEIIRRVKATIAQSPIAEGKAIESILVTEVKEV